MVRAGLGVVVVAAAALVRCGRRRPSEAVVPRRIDVADLKIRIERLERLLEAVDLVEQRLIELEVSIQGAGAVLLTPSRTARSE